MTDRQARRRQIAEDTIEHDRKLVADLRAALVEAEQAYAGCAEHNRTILKEAAQRVAAAEQQRDEAVEETRMGHVRLDECSDANETKGRPLYDRISAKLQKLAGQVEEQRHTVLALAFEQDGLRARADAAEHRRAAAEYRAQRIVLDAELEAENARLREALEPALKLAEHVSGMGLRVMAVCRQHGYVFERFPRDLGHEPPATDGERWEALAFSFYSDIAEAVSKADSALDDLRAVRSGTAAPQEKKEI